MTRADDERTEAYGDALQDFLSRLNLASVHIRAIKVMNWTGGHDLPESWRQLHRTMEEVNAQFNRVKELRWDIHGPVVT